MHRFYFAKKCIIHIQNTSQNFAIFIWYTGSFIHSLNTYINFNPRQPKQFQCWKLSGGVTEKLMTTLIPFYRIHIITVEVVITHNCNVASTCHCFRNSYVNSQSHNHIWNIHKKKEENYYQMVHGLFSMFCAICLFFHWVASLSVLYLSTVLCGSDLSASKLFYDFGFSSTILGSFNRNYICFVTRQQGASCLVKYMKVLFFMAGRHLLCHFF